MRTKRQNGGLTALKDPIHCSGRRLHDPADNSRRAHEWSNETATVFIRSFDAVGSFSVLAVTISRI